ncbi:MAG TPA: UDP-N-acetylmuramoyl-L-alanine--D-glutamate ligase [Caulobacteraceae bacterium]|nr:UDP-N-acetylmuramoyl-L-alanine--D-glutamate ligase [Caulobacteraceae bacterium]
MIPVCAFEGRTVAVFGLARSGLAAAKALKAGGASLACWDDDPNARARANMAGLDLVDLRQADWRGFAALCLSPGVPTRLPSPHWTAEKARTAGVEILGDIELFARAIAAAPAHRRPRVVAVTGTNGKSTTAALFAHVLAEAGRDARLGGNIGVPVLGLEDMHGGAVYVLELSSYQLELTTTLKANVSVILNISPDHLERHGDMAGYVAAKRRILLNQGEGDAAVIGVDDPWCAQICTEITAANRRAIWPISAGKAMGRGVYAIQGLLYDGSEGRVAEVADLNQARSLRGRHNWQNAAAAYAGVRALGLSAREAVDGLMSFPGLAHRMETVGFVGKVRFVNDSKATNVDATRQAMNAWPRFYWIAGGRPKSGGIEPLADLFGGVIKAFLVGEASADFAATLTAQRVPCEEVGAIDKAVAYAFAEARARGEEAVVLFSPACASFDQFADFEERGEAFRAAVHALADPSPLRASA